MNLKIIKPGESGKGILVEYDAGYISPKSEQNSYILESTNRLMKEMINFLFLKI